jgi:hypothetical protein
MRSEKEQASGAEQADWNSLRLPRRGDVAAEEEKPTEAPPKPDIETEPNTAPATTPVPEPESVPCPRPDTTCPIR